MVAVDEIAEAVESEALQRQKEHYHVAVRRRRLEPFERLPFANLVDSMQ